MCPWWSDIFKMNGDYESPWVLKCIWYMSQIQTVTFLGMYMKTITYTSISMFVNGQRRLHKFQILTGYGFRYSRPVCHVIWFEPGCSSHVTLQKLRMQEIWSYLDGHRLAYSTALTPRPQGKYMTSVYIILKCLYHYHYDYYCCCL